MTKSELKKLINEVLSETQFLNEGLPTGKSQKAQSAAKTLNGICNDFTRPDLQNEALKAAADIINLIDKDNKINEDVEAPDNLKYEKRGSGINITDCDPKPTGELIIPDKIDGLSVTSIGNNAFYGCSGLTSVTIPNSVTYIGGDAFIGCTGLTSVKLPSSITYIDNEAFYGCTGLTNMTIPNTVTFIGKSAFERCTGLTSVTIPNSITSIGFAVFQGCTGLKSVTLPSSLKSIGAHAFSRCTGLTSVTLPSSVSNLSSTAFPEETKIIHK